MARVRLPKLGGTQAARQPATSTTYNAQGTAQPLSLAEVGSAYPVIIQDIVPQLTSSYSRLTTYTQMMYDASVDVSMRAAKTPVLGSEFYMAPYSNSQEDRDIADFVWNNLAGGMTSPFLNSLEDILHMYEDGYSVLEKVYENRQWTPPRAGANAKMYTMLKKLAVRPPSTISQILRDNNGGPKALLHNAIQADGSVIEKQLDISKVIIFTFGRVGGDLTGRSLLRTAYPHWYYKTHFYKIDAIQKERNSLGVPRGKLLPGYTEADKILLRQLLRNLRSNEEAFAIQTPNVEIDFMEVNGNLVNVLESADHHNIMILMNVMAQFLALGTGSSGSRAVSSTQTDIFMKSLKYIANHICDMINMYLVPELVVYNFRTNNFPKLAVRNIGETKDLQMLGSALANLFSQGALTADGPTENWIRTVFDMPEKIAGTPGVDPNARQQSAVTLYDASGNAVKAIPVSTPPVGVSNNGKGSVGNNGGQGNVGKAPIGGQ